MQNEPNNKADQLRQDGSAEIAAAVRELTDQVRTVKVILIVWGAMTIVSGIGSMVWVSSGAFMPDIEHPPTAGLPGPGTGDPLPAISLEDVDGRPWTGSDWEGKIVLVNFWATWCPPCVEEMPLLDDAQRRFGDHGFVVLAISVDGPGWTVVRPYAEEHQFSYPILVADEAVKEAFGPMNSIPVSYFVGRDGRILERHAGSLDRSHLFERVESLFRDDGSDRSDPSNAENSQT